MKKYFTILLLLTVVLGFTQSQLTQSGQRLDFINLYPSAKNDKAEGSPYISQSFLTATIPGYKGRFQVRYNAHAEEMEFKSEKSIRIIPNTVDIVKVNKTNNQEELIYVPLMLEDMKNAFALLIWKDENSNALYARQNIKFFPSQKGRTSYEKDRPAMYKRNADIYYLKLSEGSLIELSSKKKNFHEVFSEKQKKVKEFVKKNKLKIDNPEHLKKIAAFYFE